MFGATPNRDAFAAHRRGRRRAPPVAYQHIPIPGMSAVPHIDPPLIPPAPTHYHDHPPPLPSTPISSQVSSSASGYISIPPPSASNLVQVAQPHNNLINHAVQSNVQSENFAQLQINPEVDLPRLPTLPTQDDDVIKIFRLLEDTTKQVKVEIVDANQNSEDVDDDLPVEMRTDCGMCFESYSVGEEKCTLPCNHTFHKVCLMKWLIENRKNQCALCRYKVTDPPVSSKPKGDGIDKKSLKF